MEDNAEVPLEEEEEDDRDDSLLDELTELLQFGSYLKSEIGGHKL